MQRKFLMRLGGVALLGLLLAMVADPLVAQTPEGTTITNTAFVDYTDANSNTYATESASVDVIVGYQAGVDVIAAAATVTPASPSVDDTLYFDVANIGNGTEAVQVDTNTTVAGVITNVSWWYNSSVYATLAALNAQLAAVTDSLAQGDTIEIRVIYDVNSGQGGQSTRFDLTATTQRAGSPDADTDSTFISPPAAYAVAVTPDDSAVSRLPSNGTNYTLQFTVTNSGNSDEDIDVIASVDPGTALTIVSVGGLAGDSNQVNVSAVGGTATVDVVVSVGDVAAGTLDTLFLLGRVVANPATTDNGNYNVTVIRPSINIAKAAYRDDQSTLINTGGGDRVVPGEFIQYLITVTNAGDADAASVHIDDTLPGQVTYDSNTPDAAGWTIVEAAGDIDADLTGTLAPAASRFFWVRVQIN